MGLPDLSKVSRIDKIKFVVFVVVIIGLAAATVALIPFFRDLIDPATREALVSKIQSEGPWGVLTLFGLQLLQVVVAFIPGEVVQVLAGVLYGGFGGWLICAIGVAFSTAVIFAIVRRLGMPFVNAMVSEKQTAKLEFLKDNKKLDMVVFILFFIPGIPKDVLTYFIPVTTMPLKRFLFLSIIARTPALIASTFAGGAFTSGDYVTMIVIFIICGTLGLAGILLSDKIFAFFSRKNLARKERIVEYAEKHDIEGPIVRKLEADIEKKSEN